MVIKEDIQKNVKNVQQIQQLIKDLGILQNQLQTVNVGKDSLENQVQEYHAHVT